MLTTPTAPAVNLPDTLIQSLPAPRGEHSAVGGINPQEVAPEFVARVPIAFARRFAVLGLTPHDGIMPMAVASEASLNALDKLTTLLGLATEPVWVEGSVLRKAIDEAYGGQEVHVESAISGLTEQPSTILEQLSQPRDLLDGTNASPVARLVDLILWEAVKRRGSDVHIQPYEDLVQVRLRVDGVLYDYVQPPRSVLDEIVSRIKVLAKMNIAEKRLAQDGRTTVTVGDKTIDLRISTLPTRCGERVVLRLLDKSARLYRLPDLGMNEAELAQFAELIRRTHGIILVCGPTGSGKTTTLYAALQELNGKELNILTLEDPIEYQLSGISQTQVSDKKGMTFATGLRHVLRQDPDVIMVGEVRDAETARMAVQSSLTGHLVFSTLHTNDAAGAVARLLDLGIEPYLVAGSILGVLAQRLVRRVCVHCRAPRMVTKDDVRIIPQLREYLGRTLYDARGCERCNQTGYRDRIGLFELLRVNDALQGLMTGSPQSKDIKQAARDNGMRTLREDAVGKLLGGVTTLDEVLRVTHADEG